MVVLIDLQGGTKEVECGPVCIILFYLFKGKIKKQNKTPKKSSPKKKKPQQTGLNLYKTKKWDR